MPDIGEQNTQEKKQSLSVDASPYLNQWLSNNKVSLALSTYQTHRLILLGIKSNGNLSLFERLFPRAMGLHASTERLYLCTKNQLWQFDNMLKQGQAYNEYDKLYVPRVAHVTGNVELHDVVEDKNGRIVFVNTLYSCLATVSDKYSFEPLWRPNFITKLVPEDRCHLNGLAMRNGLPRYVTAISRSDLNSGWRDSRDSGGVVIDIENNEVVGSDLSMPHSPRYYNGKIWVLNAGAGQLGFIDEATGKFESVAFCPGYVRGLSFHGNYAVVATSKPRHETFSGLALDDALKDKASSAKCGIHIINLESGVTENWLHFEGMISELYDVAVIPNVVRPMALGFKTDEINRMITFQDGEEQYIHMLPEVGNTKPKA